MSSLNLFSLKIRKNKIIETINATAGLVVFVAIATLIFHFLITGIFDLRSLETMLVFTISVILLFLSLGIYFKNRFAAIILVIIYSIDRLLTLMFAVNGNQPILFVGTFVGIIFLISFIRGAKAIFIYHKHIKNKK